MCDTSLYYEANISTLCDVLSYGKYVEREEAVSTIYNSLSMAAYALSSEKRRENVLFCLEKYINSSNLSLHASN